MTFAKEVNVKHYECDCCLDIHHSEQDANECCEESEEQEE